MAVSTFLTQNPFQAIISTANMRLESDRLKSYEGWQSPYMNATDLAKAGFYYTKKEDIVRCAYCNVEIGKWESGDNAVNDHRRWSPNCSFLKSIMTDNNTVTGAGEDVCGKYEFKPNSLPEGGEVLSSLQKLAIPSRKPIFPEYIVYETRLKTFQDWPKAMKQKPQEMADAGFFYTGRGDQTLCFHCGGGLKGWEDDDKPWEQHAIWFPKCSFLLLKKTRTYVEQLRKKIIENKTKLQQEQQVDEKPLSSSATETKEEEEDVTNNTFVCKICYCKKDGVLFTPCGHMIACVDCAPALSSCPICRTALESVVRVFLS